MLTAEKIYKSFGPQVVLKDVSILVRPKERVGVVGPNGAGKSTLLRILAGLMEPDKGEVSAHGRSVGYLSQESQCRLGVTVGEEMRTALPDVADVEARLLAAAAAVGAAAGAHEEKAQMAALSQATDDLHRLDAHTLDARIGRVLAGLGFELDATDRLTDTYSGGWQMRIAMAKLLLQEPDYLLLDEPTNHLDDAAKYWLMYDYIPNYPGAIVMISHDPDFLNLTVERILEMEDGQVKDYTGNFEEYIRLKTEERDRQQKEYERQQKELEKTKEFIAQFQGNKSKAGVVESRKKMLEKIDMVERPRAAARTIYLELPEAPRSNPEPVVIRNVVKKYGEKTVLDGVTVDVVRGDKIALTGPNGAGKSTLLKIIAGEVEPTRGEVAVHAKTIVGYFAQHQAEALDRSRTVLEETLYDLPTQEEEKARGLLARLLFRGDAVFKPVAVLSGGERSRVALAKFLLRPANLMLLDEPTNHLDPAARGVLRQALSQFDGTIIMASHDRDLIDEVATGEFYVENGKLTMVLDPTIARIQEA